MCLWSGHDRCQFFQQLQRFKGHMCRSIAPGALETIEQPSVRHRLETFHGKRWTSAVFAQTFKPLTISGRNGSVRMKAEAGHAGAPWTGQSVDALRINLISDPSDPAPGVGAEGDLAGYRGSVKARQPRLIPLW